MQSIRFLHLSPGHISEGLSLMQLPNKSAIFDHNLQSVLHLPSRKYRQILFSLSRWILQTWWTVLPMQKRRSNLLLHVYSHICFIFSSYAVVIFYFNVRPLKWFAVTAVHFLLLLIMRLLEFLPAWLFKLNVVVFVLCLTSRGKAARSLLNIAVFHIQTMDFMISSVNF